jgi:hypothetical protein
MNSDLDVSGHYSRGHLLERLNAALADDGVDPAHPNIDALAPYDQFHGRGIEATAELAAQAIANTAPGLMSGRLEPIEVLARRRG